MPVPKSKSGPRRLQDTRPPPSTPFAMMAAAQMHSEGRLLPTPIMDTSDFHKSSNVEDRTSQTAKQLDNALVDDSQLPEQPTPNLDKGYSMARGMGAKDLDEMAINKAIRGNK
jgi:hypothetical protein